MIREAMQQLHDAQFAPVVLETHRMIPSFTMTQQGVREASVETLMEHGLSSYIGDGLATILHDTGNYAIFANTETAPFSPIGCLVNCFPHDGRPITHTVNEIPAPERGLVFGAVDRAVGAVLAVAEKQNRPLRTLLVEQHLGPGETYHMFFYRTAYAQTHFHIYGIPYDFPSDADGFTPSRLKRKERTTFRDPAVFLARDYMTHLYPDTDMRMNPGTSAIEIPWNFDVTTDSRQQEFITGLMEHWQTAWTEIAACFTDFAEDGNGRYIPVPKPVRQARTEQFIAEHSFLSGVSGSVLRWLASQITCADFTSEAAQFSHTFKNFAGSWSIYFDLERSRRTFIFAPRMFVMGQRAGATNGYVVNTERQEWIPDTIREKLITTQKQLIQEVQI